MGLTEFALSCKLGGDKALMFSFPEFNMQKKILVDMYALLIVAPCSFIVNLLRRLISIVVLLVGIATVFIYSSGYN